jgi:hypothetical protein
VPLDERVVKVSQEDDGVACWSPMFDWGARPMSLWKEEEEVCRLNNKIVKLVELPGAGGTCGSRGIEVALDNDCVHVSVGPRLDRVSCFEETIEEYVPDERLLIAVKEPDSRGGRTVELAVREMYVTIVTCDDDKFDGSVLYEDNDAVAIGP